MRTLSFQFDMWPRMITWSEPCDFIMIFASPYVSKMQNLVVIVFWRKKYSVFSLSHDLIWPGGQRNMWLHGHIHLTISHQPAKFHDHSSCKRGYVRLLVYHVTTHHHVVRGSRESIGGFHKFQPAMFGGHRPCERGNVMFSICHVTSRDNVIRGHYGWVSLIINRHSDKFSGHKRLPCKVLWP